MGGSALCTSIRPIKTQPVIVTVGNHEQARGTSAMLGSAFRKVCRSTQKTVLDEALSMTALKPPARYVHMHMECSPL